MSIKKTRAVIEYFIHDVTPILKVIPKFAKIKHQA